VVDKQVPHNIVNTMLFGSTDSSGDGGDSGGDTASAPDATLDALPMPVSSSARSDSSNSSSCCGKGGKANEEVSDIRSFVVAVVNWGKVW